MKVRRLIIAVHRDFGYFFAGLTVIYAISGVAVNHVADWNPNYVLTSTQHEIGELADGARISIAAEVLARLGVDETPRSVVRMSPQQLKVFLDNRTLTVSVPGGHVHDEHVARRFVFYELNFLHLNHGKGVWTWCADIYALGLLILACTGIFIVPGRKGLGGRGRWLLIAGIVLPVLYLVIVS